MEVVQVLPTYFYKFNCNEKLLDSVYNQILKEKFTLNQYDGCYVTNDFYHPDLFIWIHECIAEVCKKYYSENLKLHITGCWVNKTPKYTQTVFHDHPNSILSGILYFSDEQSGSTYFNMPNPWYHVQNQNMLIVSKNENRDLTVNCLQTKINPEKGKLILFPSSIKHGVTPHTNSSLRYTLAFNTFFSGSLCNSNVTSKLNLKE